MTEPMRRTEAVYTVQVWLGLDGDLTSKDWRDVATITVPAKTKRRTVVEKAVEEYPPLADPGGAQVRVIPAEHAEPIKVEMEQPPPRLRIG